jgi:hypothetical protein
MLSDQSKAIQFLRVSRALTASLVSLRRHKKATSGIFSKGRLQETLILTGHLSYQDDLCMVLDDMWKLPLIGSHADKPFSIA